MAVHVVEQCGALLKPIFCATKRHRLNKSG
jgi:hypothetical protein